MLAFILFTFYTYIYYNETADATTALTGTELQTK